MEVMCHVCGTCFQPDIDPVDGTSNSIAVQLKDGRLFFICNYCVNYNIEKAIKMIEERGACL